MIATTLVVTIPICFYNHLHLMWHHNFISIFPNSNIFEIFNEMFHEKNVTF